MIPDKGRMEQHKAGGYGKDRSGKPPYFATR
jgi:hypothetical protein